MKSKGFMYLYSGAFLLLLISSCTPRVTPTGGTLDNPVFQVVNYCDKYGIYTFDLYYSPEDLYFTDWGSESAVADLGGFVADTGRIRDTLAVDPSISPIDFFACYGEADLPAVCDFFEVNLVRCPAYRQTFELYSIDCLGPDDAAVSIEIDSYFSTLSYYYFGTSGTDENMDCMQVNGTTQMRCTLNAIVNQPLHICYRVPGEGLSGVAHCGTIEDFYSRWQAACPASSPGPTSTAEPPAQPPVQPPQPPSACSSFTGNYDGCKAAGNCYWWSDSTCNDDPEPPPPPAPSCSDISDVTKCWGTPGCSWWYIHGCNDKPDSCAGLDADACKMNPSCFWDGSICYFP